MYVYIILLIINSDGSDYDALVIRRADDRNRRNQQINYY